MKFVLLLVACVAFAAATNSRQTEEEASRPVSDETRQSGETRQTETEETRRLVIRKEKEEFNRHPDEIVLLNGVQQCILCRETWSEALNSFSTDSPLNADGVITSDKTCRFACRGEALTKIRNMEEQEKNELVCESCRIGMDFWRAQPSKKVHYQLAKDNMCKSFTTQITREDCEHTVRMYGFDIFNALRNDVSSSSICHMYNLCGRQAAATAEFSWEEDRADELKDLESVSLDELVRNRESSETNSQEEDGQTVSTERTSSEERERLSKKTRQEQRETRRERRREERKERHDRERAEQARRHAEEMRKEESAAVSSEELQ